jgi:Uma2 family endonuclease
VCVAHTYQHFLTFSRVYTITPFTTSKLYLFIYKTEQSYDRSTKWAHYRRIATLQEFLLVSQTEYRVEQYIRQEEEVWQYIVYEGAEAVIHLPTVGLNLPLQALYRKVLPSDAL